MNQMHLWAIIPAFNESKHIEGVVREAKGFCAEVLVIDDGSDDATATAARKAGALVIIQSRNAGKGRALRTGFDYALQYECEAVVTLDADGQHRPAEIASLIETQEATGADLVIGSRMSSTRGMPWVRRLTNWFTSAVISKLTGQKIADSQSGFRLLNRRVLESIQIRRKHFDAESEFLIESSRLGFRPAEAPISTIYGEEKSKIHPLLDSWRFLRLIMRHFAGRRRMK